MDMSDLAAAASGSDGTGNAPNPMLSALIGALAGNAPLDPLALLQQQLGVQAQANPQVAQVLLLLEQRRKEQAQAAEAQAQEETAEDESEEDAAASHVIDETVRQVYSELDALRTRSQAFAAAVGACPVCFGEDPLCSECGGRGTPGRRPPDPDAFRQYVLPALRRAQSVELDRMRRGARPERKPRSRPDAQAPAGSAPPPQ
jgi:hypothetical protein